MLQSPSRSQVVRRSALAFALGTIPFAVVACSSDEDKTSTPTPPSSSTAQEVATIDVALSDAGCEPRSISAKAGPTTFNVTNDGSDFVTEFEIIGDGKLLGEVEHVTADNPRSFSLKLEAGSYRTKCPGGEAFDEGTLEVAGATTGVAADDELRAAAVQNYLTYVKGEADQLVQAVGPFAAAVKAGDIAGAKSQFASARAHYESIEPIAESFGDLDPAIDAREGDVSNTEWGGFHRLEKALWVDNNVADMGPVADKLVADIQQLRTRIDTVELEPAQIANGAVELLNEVSTSKITGEEDRYSHTDLSDFAANLAGSKAAYESLKPLLAGSSDGGTLGTELDQRFDDVQTALDQHRATDPIGNGYAVFTALSADQTRALSTTLDTLAEPLSKVAAQVL
jgi:iron uptake system component EfeO